MAPPTAIKWERIPNDKARRYRNAADHSQIISRRYYDEHFGRLAGTGLTNETLAKKNKAENPLLHDLRPRRGKRSPTGETRNLTKLIFGNRKLAHGKDNIYIGEFTFAAEKPIFLQVFYTALQFAEKLRIKMLYYLETTQSNERGEVTHTSHTHYAYLPRTKEEIIKLFDMLESFGMKYGLFLQTVTFNYRYKVR